MMDGERGPKRAARIARGRLDPQRVETPVAERETERVGLLEPDARLDPAPPGLEAADLRGRMSEVFAKLGVASRAEATVVAVAEGLT